MFGELASRWDLGVPRITTDLQTIKFSSLGEKECFGGWTLWHCSSLRSLSALVPSSSPSRVFLNVVTQYHHHCSLLVARGSWQLYAIFSSHRQTAFVVCPGEHTRINSQLSSNKNMYILIIFMKWKKSLLLFLSSHEKIVWHSKSYLYGCYLKELHTLNIPALVVVLLKQW